MHPIVIVIIVLVASTAMILFTFLMCRLLVKSDSYLSNWAKRNGLRIIYHEFHPAFGRQYFIIVQDKAGIKRSGHVTFHLLGEGYVVWDEHTNQDEPTEQRRLEKIHGIRRWF